MCYPKVSAEHRDELRNLFRMLIQDDQPMVRRCAATNFSKLATIMELEQLKSDFIPILDKLVKDNHV